MDKKPGPVNTSQLMRHVPVILAILGVALFFAWMLITQGELGLLQPLDEVEEAEPVDTPFFTPQPHYPIPETLE